MDIPRMKRLKEDLMAQVECEVAKGFEHVDTKELGEVIDMVKDLSEALYYCEITKAMQGEEYNEDYEHGVMYSTPHSMRRWPKSQPYEPSETGDPYYGNEPHEMRHP